MIPNEMKSWREVMDDVARLTKERDYAIAENKRWNERFDEQQKELSAAGLAGVLPSDGIAKLAKERDEALAEIARLREIESAELRAARDEAIRLGKERDEARAERDDALAEVVRLRASQNERAITELRFLARFFDGAESIDGYRCSSFRDDMKRIPQTFAVDMVVNRLEALRAEQAAAPAPVTHCEFCNGSLADGSDGHGLGECVPVCPTCDGSGTAKPPATSGWLHDLAFLGFAPNGRMSYRVNRFGDGAAGNPAFDLDFADLQRELRRILAQPPVTPPADAPQRPSVDELRKVRSGLPEIAARGGGK